MVTYTTPKTTDDIYEAIMDLQDTLDEYQMLYQALQAWLEEQDNE